MTKAVEGLSLVIFFFSLSTLKIFQNFLSRGELVTFKKIVLRPLRFPINNNQNMRFTFRQSRRNRFQDQRQRV